MVDMEVPETCNNSFYCEKCNYLPLCSLIKKTNTQKENQDIEDVTTSFTYDLSEKEIAYFKKWVGYQIDVLTSLHCYKLRKEMQSPRTNSCGYNRASIDRIKDLLFFMLR